MKEEKTKSKKRLIYYLVLAVSVLLLIAATVLTVYFVAGDAEPTLDVPPYTDPDEPDAPGGVTPDVPDTPSGGEAVRFIAPVEAPASTEYAFIYGNKVLRWYYRHNAIDFAAEEGAAVCAMSDGVVRTIYERPETGNYIVIDHGDNLQSVYRFIEIDSKIRVGDTIKQGQKLGTVAAAYGIEKAEGTHLHLEMVKNGKNVNPLDYIDVVFEEK